MTDRLMRFCCDCGKDTLGSTYRDDEGNDHCARCALLVCSDLTRKHGRISFRNVEADVMVRAEQRSKAKHATRVLKMAKGARG